MSFSESDWIDPRKYDFGLFKDRRVREFSNQPWRLRTGRRVILEYASHHQMIKKQPDSS
jgi:hypothetical protein